MPFRNGQLGYRAPRRAGSLLVLALLIFFAPRLAAAKKSWSELYEERKQWWSLQPLRAVKPPKVIDVEWSRGLADQFLRDRMTREQIIPAPRADPRTLVRRATLVLTGLPPAPEDVRAFVTASERNAGAAYKALVDRLLASPQYGERFARHWLDVVRFTETHGNEWNYDVPFAWRYRDYVIRAFNSDVPFDQFTREAVAGDLLPRPRWNVAERFNESVIGTAFYRFGEVNHDSCVQFGVLGYDMVDNQIDTLGKAFQATTIACARCHNHKLDAISTKDYHGMLAILRNSRSVLHTLDAPEVNRDPMARLQALKKDFRAELAAIWRRDTAAITSDKLNALATAFTNGLPPVTSPLRAWRGLLDPSGTNSWAKLGQEHTMETIARGEFNRTNFTVLADFRQSNFSGWVTDGLGLRSGLGKSGDFTIAPEDEIAVKTVLPAGAFTFALSDKLNGSLRSPTLRHSGGKVSFEVLGGRSSLARVVFNNCQLNYHYQHSLHHSNWTWVSVSVPEKTEEFHPYAELLTYWDSPKFPDPIATLSKDTENQREPWEHYAANPRTWWGVRRVVWHAGDAAPKDETGWLGRLFVGPPATNATTAMARYAQIAAQAVEAFARDRATDEDTRWLEWLLQNGLLSNRTNASPRLASLTARYRTIEREQIKLPRTMPGMADEGESFAQPVFSRGDHTKPGEAVAARYLEALDPTNRPVDARGSGRLALAENLASQANPLTARVMVNRVWQWVFGAGLARTPDDFGHVGEPPSHPELLDALAARFMAEGWSVKKLVRELVLSRAFQSASVPTASAHEKDPLNVLLSHFSARRAEAEAIRDSLLAVSGRLDSRLYGPAVYPYREKADPEKRLFTGPLEGDGRRSIYLKFQLMEAPKFLSAFNLPGGKVAQGRRDTTNVPAQSLALLNDPLVLALSDYWAARLVADGSATVDARLERMFQTALGRPPGTSELERFRSAVRSFAELDAVPSAGELGSRTVWRELAHVFFNLKEFVFIP